VHPQIYISQIPPLRYGVHLSDFYKKHSPVKGFRRIARLMIEATRLPQVWSGGEWWLKCVVRRYNHQFFFPPYNPKTKTKIGWMKFGYQQNGTKKYLSRINSSRLNMYEERKMCAVDKWYKTFLRPTTDQSSA